MSCLKTSTQQARLRAYRFWTLPRVQPGWFGIVRPEIRRMRFFISYCCAARTQYAKAKSKIRSNNQHHSSLGKRSIRYRWHKNITQPIGGNNTEKPSNRKGLNEYFSLLPNTDSRPDSISGNANARGRMAYPNGMLEIFITAFTPCSSYCRGLNQTSFTEQRQKI